MKRLTDGDLNKYIGNKFNLLTIIKVFRVGKNIIAECQCDCGGIKSAVLKDISYGKTSSCGCKRNLPAIERNLRKSELPFGESSFRALYLSYKNSAKERNLCFELTQEDFRSLTSKDCYYCGIPPQAVRKKVNGHGHYTYNGIDRLDNSNGYEIWNCVACCKFCNRAKDTLSQSDFLFKIEAIYNTKFKNALK